MENKIVLEKNFLDSSLVYICKKLHLIKIQYNVCEIKKFKNFTLHICSKKEITNLNLMIVKAFLFLNIKEGKIN